MYRFLCLMAGFLANPALAGSPEVLGANALRQGDTWRIEVTVAHDDTGWEHYADAWAVFDEAGEELARRVLAHPHVNEQPFTRSMSGIVLPEGTVKVFVRAHDSVHGWGEEALELPLQ